MLRCLYHALYLLVAELDTEYVVYVRDKLIGENAMPNTPLSRCCADWYLAYALLGLGSLLNERKTP